MNQGGIKHDTGKAPLSLLDRHAMEQIGAVLAFGAKKYAAHNWRGGIAYSRLLDAALRHLYAFADGEDLDPESGLPHVAHAGCCVVFLLGMMKHRPDMDDRWSTAAKLENALMSDVLTQTFGDLSTGLHQFDSVAPLPNVDELVASPAVGTDEVDAEVVNAGLNGLECNLSKTTNADPHDVLPMDGTDFQNSRKEPV